MEKDEVPIRAKIANNVSADFMSTLESELRWGADTAWREVLEPNGLGSPPTSREEIALELDRMIRERRLLGCRALLQSAKYHGIPFECRNVGGGHQVVFAQFGSVILSAEPIRYVEQRPQAAAYKLDLAKSHQQLLQLELPFKGTENRLDPRGVTFGIIQHIVPLRTLERGDCMLTGMRLVVPDRDFLCALIAENVLGEYYERNFVLRGDSGEIGWPQEDRAVPRLRARVAKKREDHVG